MGARPLVSGAEVRKRVGDGKTVFLDVRPAALHQRVPVILGSRNEVERIVAYHGER